MDKYHKKSHCKYLIKIHLVFVTKYRKNIIKGNFRCDLLNILYNISLEKGFIIDVMESDVNHVHILVDIPPQLSTYRLYQIHKEYLKKYYWKENTLFSDGYFSCSTGDASSEMVRKYIEEQV